MKRSAAWSSSAVVTPGRAFERRISWHRTKIRPAAAILSSSSGVFRRIMALDLRLEGQGRQCGTNAAVDLVRRARAVEAPQQPAILVPFDQRLGLLVVDGEAVPCCLRPFGLPLGQPPGALG